MIASSGYCGASVVCCNVDVEIGGVRFVDSVRFMLLSQVELGLGAMLYPNMSMMSCEMFRFDGVLCVLL